MGGEQTGPFTESELIRQIQQQIIPEDALVWYEGLGDWMPLSEIPSFAAAFSGGATSATSTLAGPAAAAPTNVTSATRTAELPTDDFLTLEDAKKGKKQKKKKKKDADDAEAEGPSTYSSFAQGAELKPVFSAKSATIGKAAFSLPQIRSMLVVGVLLAVGSVVAVFWDDIMSVYGSMGKMAQSVLDGDADAKKKKDALGGSPAPGSKREGDFRTAQSELLLKPEASLQVLKKVVAENPEDKIGKEAMEVALSYYRQTQRFSDAGRLMLQAKREEEAAKFFLQEPPSFPEAESALFTAYEKEKDPVKKRELLVKNIEILLGPLARLPQAVERIRLLEKEFPNQAHPFGYYLKSDQEKIGEMFNRVSFHFVQTFIQFMTTEFPAVSLAKRPIVEVIKEKSGVYRVVGRYRGDVQLNRDELKDIVFIAWFDGASWQLVETNVTGERRKVASVEKSRQKEKTFTETAMLDFLQNVFKLKFPKAALHDPVDGKSATSKRDDF